MKKIIYILTFAVPVLFGACSEQLITEPTDKVSGQAIFADAVSSQTAMNGVYRMLYVAKWSQGWSDENNGQTGINLLADLMGEDHLMKEQGNGWFYEDYRLNVHGDYSHKSGRSYAVWNFYYTMISNVNYIIAAENIIEGNLELKNSVIAQAHAMRAYAYFYLIQLFQQTYKGNESAPGVPLYTEPTVAGSEGKPRGTVEAVYSQINSDLDRSIALFKELENKSQIHKSHVDYYVANGIKARVALVQHNYEVAAEAAAEALKQPNITVITVNELGGNNDYKKENVLWGVEIIKDQSSGYAGFFGHMDADATGMYAGTARQCISTGLYKLIPNTDERLAWFRGELSADQEELNGSMTSYCQLKFKMADYTTRTGDYLLMRAEEMILIKAEAECHQEKYTEARTTIKELGSKRDSKFNDRLAGRTDSKEFNKENSNAPLVTLMDEILFQRRLELWGEAGRIFDLQRLGMGYDRTYEGSNHTQTLATKNTKAGSPLFIFPLPQSEIDGNENISDKDQNPIVQ